MNNEMKKPGTEGEKPEMKEGSETSENSSEQPLSERIEEKKEKIKSLKEEVNRRLDDLLNECKNLPEYEANVLLFGILNSLNGLKKELKSDIERETEEESES